MRVTIVLAISLLAMAVTFPAVADQSIFGPSGLLRTPMTDTLESGSIVGSAAWVTSEWFNVNVSMGLTDRLELDASYLNADDGGDETIISGTWRFWGEFEDGRSFGLAAGLFDISDELNRSLFVTAEKHMMLGDTRARLVAGWGENNSLVEGLFVGTELFLGRDFSFLAEYDGDDLNAAIRWPFSDEFRATAGLVSEKLFVGAEYQFH